MKRGIIFGFMVIMTVLVSAQTMVDSILQESDTTFAYQDKLIAVSNIDEQLKVSVFEQTEDNGLKTMKQVYEGIYSDEKSFERYMVSEDFGFQLPFAFAKKKKTIKTKMEGHWAGFGVGLSNISSADYQFSTFNGYRLNAEKSLEWIWNTNEFCVPIIGNFLGLTSGFGFDWRNYVLEDRTVRMDNTNGIISWAPNTENITYESTRLRTLHLTVPLFLEWQPQLGGKRDVFITAGIVGGLKAFSNHKIIYEEGRDKVKLKTVNGSETNMPPLTLDYMVQAGIKKLSLYAKYSPFGMFRSGSGSTTDPHAISLGIMLNFH